jgi:hypothetical protein
MKEIFWVRQRARRRSREKVLRSAATQQTVARAIAVDSYFDTPLGPHKTKGVQIRGYMVDLAEMPAYYRVTMMRVDTIWPPAESGPEDEVDVPANRRMRPRVLGHRRNPQGEESMQTDPLTACHLQA